MGPSSLVRSIATGAALVVALHAPQALAEEATEPAAETPSPVNLDFEAGAGERGWPTGWGAGAPGYELTVDSETAHGGEASVRIELVAEEPPERAVGSLTQWVSAEAWRGKRVRLSGWLRTRKVESGWAGLWMRVDSKVIPALAFDNMADRGPRGTRPWRRAEVVLDVDEAATEVFFGVLLVGDGTVWADDLALEEVPQSVPTTEPDPEG